MENVFLNVINSSSLFVLQTYNKVCKEVFYKKKNYVSNITRENDNILLGPVIFFLIICLQTTGIDKDHLNIFY